MSATAFAHAAQYLTFTVAGELYAIEILRIREILEFGSLTAVPKTPDWLRGVINLRGSVVPIVDLSRKLGMGATVPTRLTCSIIIEADVSGEKLVVGLMAESVSQVIELTPEMIEPPPTFGTRLAATFLLGMAQSESKFALLLDIDRLLGADDAAVLMDGGDGSGADLSAAGAA